MSERFEPRRALEPVGPMLAMFVALTAVIIGVIGATGVEAQPHSDGWFVPGTNHLHRVEVLGNVESAGFTNRAIYAATMSLDNQTILVFDQSRRAIVKVDPQMLRAVDTFFASPLLSDSASVVDMVFDSDGSLFFSSWHPLDGIFKIPFGTNRIVTITSSGPFANGAGNLSLDIDTGELIATAPALSPGSTIAYLVQRDGGSAATLATGLDVRYGTYKHINSGDLFSGTCCGAAVPGPNAQSILVARFGAPAASIFLNDPVLRGGYSPQPDRASAATQQLVVAAWFSGATPGADGLWAVDVNTSAARKLASIPTGSVFKAVPIEGRNLASVRAGTRKWDLRVSFPRHPHATFLLLAGMSGVRPGFDLADGRKIPLKFDALTAIGFLYGLPPFMPELHGSLGDFGEATVALDLGSLPALPQGLRLHFVPIVVDPIAPFGLAVIGDPIVIPVS